MGDANDFTFCQVGSKVDDYLESPETIPNIGAISLEESHLNGPGTSKSNNSLQNDDSVDNAISEESVANDSLPSKTIKTLPHKFKLDESVKPGVSGGIGESVNGSQELKPATKIVRTKVPFEKGYSQMDWLKITRTHPDLAGLKGQSNRRLISMDEIRQHKTGDSIWTVLKGRVYNISPYMKFHPGGVDMLMKASGKDCTALFNKYHAWVNAEFLLEKCLVGFLDDSQ